MTEYKINTNLPVVDVSVSSESQSIVFTEYNIYGGLQRTDEDTKDITITQMLPTNIVLNTSVTADWITATTGTVYDETAAVLNVSINANTTQNKRVGRIYLEYNEVYSDNYIQISQQKGSNVYTYRILWHKGNNHQNAKWNDGTTTDKETFETGITKTLKLTQSPGTLSDTNYTFTGWSLTSDTTPTFTNTDIINGNVEVSSNTNYYACFKQTSYYSDYIYFKCGNNNYNYMLNFSVNTSNIMANNSSSENTYWKVSFSSTTSGIKTISIGINAMLQTTTTGYNSAYISGSPTNATNALFGSGTNTDPYVVYIWENGHFGHVAGNVITETLTLTFS